MTSDLRKLKRRISGCGRSGRRRRTAELTNWHRRLTAGANRNYFVLPRSRLSRILRPVNITMGTLLQSQTTGTISWRATGGGGGTNMWIVNKSMSYTHVRGAGYLCGGRAGVWGAHLSSMLAGMPRSPERSLRDTSSICSCTAREGVSRRGGAALEHDKRYSHLPGPYGLNASAKRNTNKAFG